jgi:hypothetical protein
METITTICPEFGMYFRDDPDSNEARYFPETGEDMDVGASLTIYDNTFNFIWKRYESNQNLTNHGFTHYLTMLAYADELRLIEGQKVVNDIVDLGTEDENIGLLCSLPVEVIKGRKIEDFYEDGIFPLSVLLLVRQNKSQSDKIRLITCYPTNNPVHIKWYSHHCIKPRKSIDEFEKEAESLGIQLDKGIVSLYKTEAFRRSAQMFKEVSEELRKEMEENLFKGYQVFTQSLKDS